MKTLIATLLATAAGASFAAAPTAALNHDPATYRNVTQKALSEYRTAIAKCDSMSGNDKEVCVAEAKLARTRTEYDALSQYNNTASGRAHARTNVADAEYALAKAKCDASTGADKDSCMSNARSVHTAALADAKSGRTDNAPSTGSSGGSGSTGSSAAGAQAAKSAVDKCAQAGGDSKTGCLVETRPSAVRDNVADAANRTGNAAENAADNTRNAASTAASKTRDAAATAAEKTKAVAATAAEKTKEVAQTAVEKTKQAASTVAQKTENAMDHAGADTRQAAAATAQKTDNALDRAGANTRQAAATTADKTADATARTRVAASDTAITTKVKAGLVKAPNLDSLGIHVETEKGVVMLSGFVDSKAQADQAVQVAKGVDGVTNVKSAIKVK
jgi:osmotically-inducible protein OsmY